MAATTKEIAHAAASLASSALTGFRYFRSYGQARRRTGEIVNDVIFSVTTPGGGNPCSLKLYFGVQHRLIESTIASLQGRKLNAYARTIFRIPKTFQLRADGNSEVRFAGTIFGYRGTCSESENRFGISSGRWSLPIMLGSKIGKSLVTIWP